MKNRIVLFLLTLSIIACTTREVSAQAGAATASPGSTIESPTAPAKREGKPFQRYEMLNERVKQNQGRLDVLFVGDSITQGWEGAGKEVWEKFYGSRKALNIGIGGDWTQHVLWRLENGNANGIDPKVTVLMIGTNNSGEDRHSASQMVEGVTAVVRKLQEKLPQTRILLLAIFPRGEQFNAQRGKILQVNQALRKLEDGKRIVFLDFGHAFINRDGSIPKDIMPDFLHLSPRGYTLWAEAMEPKLQGLLAQ